MQMFDPQSVELQLMLYHSDWCRRAARPHECIPVSRPRYRAPCLHVAEHRLPERQPRGVLHRLRRPFAIRANHVGGHVSPLCRVPWAFATPACVPVMTHLLNLARLTCFRVRTPFACHCVWAETSR